MSTKADLFSGDITNLPHEIEKKLSGNDSFCPLQTHYEVSNCFLRFHSAPMGTLVFPVAIGEVVGVQYDDGSYGRTINLKFSHDGKTCYAFYAHPMNVLVTTGCEVQSTSADRLSWRHRKRKGNCRQQSQLHFEFRNRQLPGNGLTNRIDPVELLGEPRYDGIYYIDDEQAGETGGNMSFDPQKLPSKVYQSYKMGVMAWPLTIQQALYSGIHDLNKLTDIVFYLHYPDLVGRSLGPDDTELIKKWKAFRGLVASRRAAHVGNLTGNFEIQRLWSEL